MGLKMNYVDPPNDADEEECDDEEPESARGYQFDAVPSENFFAANYSIKWLVSRVLVAGQPAVLGGPKKSLKTSILIDLAVSLASATPFLGRFDVYAKHRVALISGESGEAAIQDCGRRVCRARGTDPSSLPIWWSFRLPQVGSAIDRQRLREGLAGMQADVAIIDPLYLCLLAGSDARDVNPGNLYAMGPLLSDLSRCCLDVGATPVLAHHAKKGGSSNRDPLDLDDLSFSGIAEFARQWLLVSRREPFDPDTGEHKMWLSVGGSAGQSGCWALDVREGVLSEDFSGRVWDVDVQTATALRDDAQARADEKKRDARREREREDEDRFMAALDKLALPGEWAGVSRVKNESGLSGDRTNAVMHRLIIRGVVERTDNFVVQIGSNTSRPARGVRRTKEEE